MPQSYATLYHSNSLTRKRAPSILGDCLAISCVSRHCQECNVDEIFERFSHWQKKTKRMRTTANVMYKHLVIVTQSCMIRPKANGALVHIITIKLHVCAAVVAAWWMAPMVAIRSQGFKLPISNTSRMRQTSLSNR